MKSFRYFLFLFVLAPLSVLAKNQILFIDPGFKDTVPVYGVNADGSVSKKAITSVYPGDFLSTKSSSPKKIGKKEYFIINAKDESGKDIEVAIDTKSVNFDVNKPENSAVFIAPANARKIKIDGKGNTFGTEDPGMDRSTTCALSKEMGSAVCKEFSPGQNVDVDDAVLALTTDGESPKLKWRSYVKDKNGYWLDSESTTGVDGSFSSTETKPAIDNCNDKYPTAEMASEADKIATEQQLDEIMPNIGECYDSKKVAAYVAEKKHEETRKILNGEKIEKPKVDLTSYQNAIIDGVVSKPLSPLFKEKRMPDGNVEIVNATRADWASIDVLARTLYGEMASCFNKGDKYPEAVAKVALNRVDCSKESAACKARFIKGEPDPGRVNDITLVAFKPYQFSIWNPDDKARRMAMCPPSNPNRSSWQGHPPRDEELKLWRDAVRFATNAVLKGETFRRKTGDLKSLYYSSGLELSKSDFKSVTDAKIGGRPLPLSRCIQIWNEKKLAKDVKKYSDIFHPLFLKALHAIAGN